MKKLVRKTAEASLPTKNGNFKVICYEDCNKAQHLALISGNLRNKNGVLVRVHSECLTGDALGSLRCDCGLQLEKALEIIGKKGGVLLYMAQEGRGIGLMNKTKAYKLQEQGYDTVEANMELGYVPDLRDYNACAVILKDYFKITSVRLLTNNLKKSAPLKEKGISVVLMPIKIEPNEHNKTYLTTKKAKVIVNEDQAPLAIGSRGINVNLASRLTEYTIDIVQSTKKLGCC